MAVLATSTYVSNAIYYYFRRLLFMSFTARWRRRRINSTPHPQPAQLWARTLCQCRSSEQDRILVLTGHYKLATLAFCHLLLLLGGSTSTVNVIFLTRTPTGI